MTQRRPNRRQEQQAETRRKLLAAAHDAFIAHGYVSTTVDEICQAAGTGRATFYLHFRGKPDVLTRTWLEFDYPKVDAAFRRYDEQGAFGLVPTRDLIASIVEIWERTPMVAITAAQALALESELADIWLGGMQEAARQLPRWTRSLDQESAVADARALSRIFQLERSLYFWIIGAYPFPREILIESLAREWALEN